MARRSKKQSVAEFFNELAPSRDKWIRRNNYYYQDLLRFFRYTVPRQASILEIGCGTGELLGRLNPRKGTGIDIAPAMVAQAKAKFPRHKFLVMDAENITVKDQFDNIIVSDTVGYFEDVQMAFRQLRKLSHSATRIVITYQNLLWLPLLNLAEVLGIKMPSQRLNWLNQTDLTNLLALEGFEVVKTGKRLLLPRYIPLLSWLINKYLAHLPIINTLCLTQYIIARPVGSPKTYSVSVIIPARNERDNIEQAVLRMPRMGKSTEIVFVEGHSSDGTLDEIKRVYKVYKDKKLIKYSVQPGKGKSDAVRKGFALARGDIVMILDADLTVPPEDLVKFYRALSQGKGEFINGSRLIYPMEKEAMRTLNLLANRLFSLMFTWLLGQPIKDTLCGTKALLKRDYNRLAASRSFFGDFDPFGDFDLLFGASKLNLKIVEVPIRYQARHYGTTNISRFKHGWLLIKMVLFAMNKIKFF